MGEGSAMRLAFAAEPIAGPKEKPPPPTVAGAAAWSCAGDRQTAITVTDFVTRYGSSASGPPSDP